MATLNSGQSRGKLFVHDLNKSKTLQLSSRFPSFQKGLLLMAIVWTEQTRESSLTTKAATNCGQVLNFYDKRKRERKEEKRNLIIWISVSAGEKRKQKKRSKKKKVNEFSMKIGDLWGSLKIFHSWLWLMQTFFQNTRWRGWRY